MTKVSSPSTPPPRTPPPVTPIKKKRKKSKRMLEILYIESFVKEKKFCKKLSPIEEENEL